MNFTYETQGAITYLVCEVDAAEQMDTLTLGMLTNNRIQGLAPVIYTEMNGQRFLKYNISAKVTVEQFFCGGMNKSRALKAFSNILNALCSADEYMIDPNCFSVAPEHIFLNVSNCETALICVPVISDKDINTDVAELFKKILFSTQFDQSEDAGYITQLITYLNGSSFSIYGLNDLVTKIQAGGSVPSQPSLQPSVQSAYKPPVQPAMATPTSFDSTISIDDIPASMGGRKQPIQTPPVQKPPVQPAPAPSYRPVTPPVTPMPQNRPVAPVTPPTSAPQPSMRQPVKPQTPPMNIPKPPATNGPGFAIPGQAMPVAKPPIPEKNSASAPAPTKASAQSQTNGEKKISFFGLLANYSKENKALYKAQKEANKKAKATSASTSPAPNAPTQGRQPVVPQIPGGVSTQAPPSHTQPQFRPAAQPVPVQNSFNETTVLTPTMLGGETTVLNENPGVPNPTLTRVKTGERISINKPVFRIGKEKSYVDYFIGDNTAISRSHCNIHTENGEYFIEDTNSTNHTYLNGKIIASNVKTKITSGDKVKLANEDFIFSI